MINIFQDECLDCGAKKTPGWGFCQSCGSQFENQIERTYEEQQRINIEIKKNQKVKKKEFRKWKLEKWKKTKKEEIKKNIKEQARISLAIVGVFIIISIVTGIIGSFVGLIYFDQGGWGFLIGFLVPLAILILWNY